MQILTYKNVYITVSQEALKIDQALSRRFNQNPQQATETELNILPTGIIKYKQIPTLNFFIISI